MLLPNLFTDAAATTLQTVAPASSGFGPLIPILIVAALVVALIVIKRKSPATAGLIENAAASGWSWIVGLFRK